MIYPLGTGLIVLALLSSAVSSVAYAAVTTGRNSLLQWGRIGAWVALLSAGGSALFLLMLFVNQRYDIRYVYDYSSQDLEMRYRMAAVWAGQPGSLVVWAMVGLICAPFLMRRTRNFEPYILASLMLLQTLLLMFMLVRNPFLPTELEGMAAGQPIVDGRGLNPQLHNVWMVIHPPTLFTGYGLLGVPFCMALAGLWRRDYDNWARMALPWTVAGWTVLGLALTMGGYWAYESLGWGGYWGWDPVESSALLPWLTGAALVHGLLVQRTHGSLRRSNLTLAIVTYFFVFFASFLTRSGVLGSFSVHSFVEEGLKNIMLATMTALLALGILLLGMRWRDIPGKPLSQSLLSRHTVFALMMVTFVILAVIIGAGTSMPWVTSIAGLSHNIERFIGSLFEIDDGTRYNGQPFGDGRFALMPEFFKSTSSPLALILAALMSIGPLLGWRDTNARKLLRWLRWPFVAGVLAAGVGIWLGVRDTLSIAFLLVCAFALGTNGLMIARTFAAGAAGWLKIGGYLAHVGMAILLVGVVGSSAYASPEEKLVIPQGETQRMYDHSFTFWGYETQADGKHVLRLEVDKDSDTPFVARPDVYYNDRMETWVRTPAIKRYLWKDLYISPEEYVPPDDPNAATLGLNKEGIIGPYRLRFDQFEVDEHMGQGAPTDGTLDQRLAVGATVTITHEQGVETFTPWLAVSPDGIVSSLPEEMGDGRQVILEQVSVNTRQVRVRITGLNLPVVPARAVMTVSTKPAIALVWIGAVLIVLGGSVAVVRRRWEAVEGSVRSPSPATQPASPGLRGWGLRLPGWRGADH